MKNLRPKQHLDPRNEEHRKLVQGVWYDIEDKDPDISTERLIRMTSDTLNIPYGDVVDFLNPNLGSNHYV